MIYKGYGFFFFENTKARIMNNQLITNRSALIFLSASIAGLMAQLISYPFDVLKKKFQATQENEKQ